VKPRIQAIVDLNAFSSASEAGRQPALSGMPPGGNRQCRTESRLNSERCGRVSKLAAAAIPTKKFP